MDAVDVPELTATLEATRVRLVDPGHLSVLVLRHGTMELRVFRPDQIDDQTPHDRDEMYLVATGTAVMLRGTTQSPWQEPALIDGPDERIALSAGDAVVVPAGTPHHFTDVSPDFATWAVFWGPEGGERV